MKLSCEVIQDLLPLYVDEVCSEESTGLVEEHMAECENCRQTYDAMKAEGKTEELVKSEEFRTWQTDSVKKVKKKWSKSKKIFLILGIILGAGLLYILIRVAMIFGIMSLVIFDSATTKVQVYDDVANYSDYIGMDCNMKYGKPRTGQFVVFPEKITSQMHVQDFQYVYYNPWDPQYVVYLTVEYKDAEAYGKELKRLQTIGVEEYEGIYSVTGEPEGYDLVAMDQDRYYGFVYAMVPETEEMKITYVGIMFCNYFLDLDIHEYMKKEYLLPGFDATLDNPYEQEMMGK
ncbi:MAG: zf-HC2 domain-containing protein [Lachnospiraceae bacterium]|nr:zf-HC2 domain-containing protein [Lachnospiraceae bacterium]